MIVALVTLAVLLAVVATTFSIAILLEKRWNCIVGSQISFIAGAVTILLLLSFVFIPYIDSRTILSGNRMITYYTRYKKVSFSPQNNFNEIIANPAVWEVSWSECTNDPGTKLYFDWVRGRGFLHRGTSYKVKEVK